ncbi:unnamed protein product [Onchocerca ochengi]|uniref:MIT domain-containing protein n=1 Tax=Onchocerca ochengi TaxID=42157 RepID=A0A182E5E7_ONCOC|nr:unnamed protein product [Onchocerca ochengi]
MQSFIDKSKPILQKAVALDRDNKKHEAVENYTEGITLLLSAMSCDDTIESTKEVLREKISKYLSRAETGFGYERIFRRCADNVLTEINVRDAYIMQPYQVLNFVRFCELFVLYAPNLKTIRLWTHYSAKAESLLQQLKGSLACRNIELDVCYDENFHDREIRLAVCCMMLSEKKQKSAAVCGLDAYKTNLMKQAEKIVLEEFPRKVLEFNNLLEGEQFSYERLPELLPNIDLGIPYAEQLIEYTNDRNSTEHENDDGVLKKKRKIDHANIQPLHGTSVYGFINGTVKCNEKLASLTDITRPLLRDSVEAVNKVKMWILFLIPRIEDGNNFGVSIQEEALSEVRTVEGEAASFLDQMSRYFVSRARLVTKVAKYPHVEDYRRAILDMDEKQFINIRLVLTEMRNHFATLHDMITKNLEKIKTPRSNNTEHMY